MNQRLISWTKTMKINHYHNLWRNKNKKRKLSFLHLMKIQWKWILAKRRKKKVEKLMIMRNKKIKIHMKKEMSKIMSSH